MARTWYSDYNIALGKDRHRPQEGKKSIWFKEQSVSPIVAHLFWINYFNAHHDWELLSGCLIEKKKCQYHFRLSLFSASTQTVMNHKRTKLAQQLNDKWLCASNLLKYFKAYTVLVEETTWIEFYFDCQFPFETGDREVLMLYIWYYENQ